MNSLRPVVVRDSWCCESRWDAYPAVCGHPVCSQACLLHMQPPAAAFVFAQLHRVSYHNELLNPQRITCVWANQQYHVTLTGPGEPLMAEHVPTALSTIQPVRLQLAPLWSSHGYMYLHVTHSCAIEKNAGSNSDRQPFAYVRCDGPA